MSEKRYDLEERTLRFAKNVALFVRQLPMDVANREYGKQLVRAAGSVGANYIEANESLGEKDFAMRIRISRKEAKEARYWIRLTGAKSDTALTLEDEATQLMNIFGSILKKVST